MVMFHMSHGQFFNGISARVAKTDFARTSTRCLYPQAEVGYGLHSELGDNWSPYVQGIAGRHIDALICRRRVSPETPSHLELARIGM